jgi:hypothetical protein
MMIFLPWAAGSMFLSLICLWLAAELTKSSRKDPLNGLAYVPGLFFGGLAVILFAAFFHWAIGLFLLFIALVALTGMVLGWFY